jgi:oligoendopeptidase F
MAKRIEYVDAYASRLADTDMRVSRHQAMTSAAEKIHTDYLAAIAYMEPELLAQPESRLKRFATDKRLRDYDRFFIELIRLKRHVLSKKEEGILAKASVMAMAAYNIYKTFANADMEFPSFVDQKGRTVVLSAAMYARYRKSPHRADRKVVFEKFWKTYKKYRNSFSQMFGAQIKYYDFVARIRRYKDALEASLKPNAIPPVFYTNLIKSVTANLGAFHRYLKLRKKFLGIRGEQYYYDVYPLLTGKSAKKYTFEQSRRIIMQALRPLGQDYMRRLKAALADNAGWLDVFPNKGKRSGAYSSSVYGAHPLVLLNHTDDFDSLSTLAHELGHALHSAYSNETQPYPKADYALFNAEVASIFNETLLIEFLLKKEKNPEQRKFLLSAYLDSFRGTVFRQTMFAEFELEAYRRLASRKSLTADSLSRLYLKLLRKYHGHDKGVMNIQPLYGIEWAYIPHFYYNFYVYQYVSGFVAATALARRVLEKGEPAARQYIDKLLKAGSSKDPIDILKEAGVDMTTSRPFDEAAKLFADRVRELEKLAR